MLGLLAAALGAPAAQAHVPHDIVDAVAAPADLDPAATWLLLSLGEGWQVLSHSEDGGRTWTMTMVDPMVDDLVAVAVLDDGAWVLASEGRVWWSYDDGGSWERTAAPAPIRTLVGGADLALATDDGVWTFSPGAAPVRVADGEVIALSTGPDGRVALTAEGEVWVDRGGWESVGRAPVAGTAAAVTGGGTLVGAPDGTLWRSDDGEWSACGLVPEAPGDVVRIAADGDVVLVASASGHVYATDPTCAAWRDVASPVVVDYGGAGGATSPAEAATALAVADGRWLHAGWAGVAIATDGAWYSPVVIPADYTRGVAFSPDYARDGRIWVGGYAGGLATTVDGGATWDAQNTGLGEPNLQRLLFPFGADDDDDVVALCDYSPWTSHDGGHTWAEQASPYRFPVGMAAWEGGEVVWAFADPTRSGDPPVSVSEDGGATWREDAALTAALGDSTPGGVTRVDWPGGRLAIAAGSPTRVIVQGDDGAWAPAYVDPLATGIVGPIGWPAAYPARLLFADSAGIHRSDDGEQFTTWDGLGEDRAQALVGVDHTLFLATRAGWLWRSDDGGRSWVDLRARAPAPVHALAGAKGADGALRLVIGTQDGTFTLTDPRSDTPDVVRWAPYQRVDDLSPYLACDGCDSTVRDDAAAMSSLRPLGASGVARVTVRGESIRIYGTSVAQARVAVSVDGRRRGTIAGQHSPTPGELMTIDGLSWGWHDLELRAEADGVQIDAVEATASGALFPTDEAPSGGCGGGAGAALLGLAAAGAARRRGGRTPARRDPPQRTPTSQGS